MMDALNDLMQRERCYGPFRQQDLEQPNEGPWQHWRLRRDDSEVAWLLFDQQGQSANLLGSAALRELGDVLASLRREMPRALVLRSAKASSFCLGADLHDFAAVDNEADAVRQLVDAHLLAQQLIDLPCPTLAVVHGDTLGGGINLFALGLGMGTPLLLITLFGKSLLPGSGPWMETVKHLFGFGLLAVAIWLLERVLPGPLSLALWASLAAGLAVRLASLQSGQYLRQTIALLFGLYAAAALFGALAGGEDPLRPLQPLTGGGNSASSAFFTTVDDPAQLQQALNQAAKQGQPAIVDLYADWCISCKVMERTILNQPEIQTLLGNHLRLKLDVTDNTPAQREWLTRQQLFGPPAYLFFAADGSEQRDLRIQGEVSKDEFAALARRASQK